LKLACTIASNDSEFRILLHIQVLTNFFVSGHSKSYFSPTSPLLHPYFSPTSALCDPIFPSTSPLRQLYFSSTSALLQPYFIQLYSNPNFTPTSLLRHPYVTPISALLQLYFRYKLRFRTAHNSEHRCNRQQCVTAITLQPYFSSTSVPLQLYFSSTSALLQLYCSYTSALLQFYFTSTSAVLQLYFSLQPDQTQAGTYKLRFRMVFQAMMLLMMM
jgi:hypothetical protein